MRYKGLKEFLGYVSKERRRWAVWDTWLCGFITISATLVRMLSLGILSPGWTLDYIRWHTARMIAKRSQEN